MLSGFAGRDVAVILAAYAIGCFATGYYLVRWRTGQDVRAQGTGSVGARNVGRALGKHGFAYVLLGDAAKGALAVGLGRWLGEEEATPALAAVAVTAGHLFPVQLGFRGGKGAATVLGAGLVLVPVVALTALASAGLALAAGVRAVPAALIGAALAPGFALLLGHSAATVWGVVGLVALVIFGHRQNIAGMIGRGEPWLRRDRARARNQERRSAGTAADGRPS